MWYTWTQDKLHRLSMGAAKSREVSSQKGIWRLKPIAGQIKVGTPVCMSLLERWACDSLPNSCP